MKKLIEIYMFSESPRPVDSGDYEPSYWGDIVDSDEARAVLRKFVDSFQMDPAKHVDYSRPSVDSGDPMKNMRSSIEGNPHAPPAEFMMYDWLLYVDDFWGDHELREAISSGNWKKTLQAAKNVAEFGGIKLPLAGTARKNNN